MEDREEKLDAIYNMIEKDLSLVGTCDVVATEGSRQTHRVLPPPPPF